LEQSIPRDVLQPKLVEHRAPRTLHYELGLPTGMTTTQHNQAPPARHSIDAVKTWRYLRLSMVAVVTGLAAAVVYEHFQTKGNGCFQTSVSAYYYTPARSVFVAALVSIGVAMICLRGSTPWEDLLLNLAGMFAPVVAFVPTPDPGTCWSVKSATEARAPNIANNLTALLIAGGLALAFAISRAWRERSRHEPRRARIAVAIAVAVWVAVLCVHAFDGEFFDSYAHATAATAMFLCIIAVVCINAREFKPVGSKHYYARWYTAVAVAMVVVLAMGLVVVVVHWLGGELWSYLTIVVETLLLILFATFWVIQTCELWNDGLRPPAK
jgi:hypothetical protein